MSNVDGQGSEMDGPSGAAATNRVARQESEMDGPSCAAGTAGTASRTPVDNVATVVQAGTAPRTRIDDVAGAVVGDRNDSRRGLGVEEPVRSEGDVSLDPSSNADDYGDIERSDGERVDPSEGEAPDPPGIYDSNATSGERGLEPIASTEISSLLKTEHMNVERSSGGLDPPSRAFPTDNGVSDGDGQLNVLTISGDLQQQQSLVSILLLLRRSRMRNLLVITTWSPSRASI